MVQRVNYHGLTVSHQSGCQVIALGPMEIWDGTHLALLRDALVRLVIDQQQRSIGIDMSCVQHLPSGFFGMLCDWFDQGVAVRLFSPRPRVTTMLWFRQFFRAESAEIYYLADEEADCPEKTPVTEFIPTAC